MFDTFAAAPTRAGFKPRRKGDFPTLGYLALDWMTTYLSRPTVTYHAPFEPTREQAEFLLKWYRLDPITGERVYRRGVIQRSKGWGKSPFLAAIAAFEALGPCRFAGWDAEGQPVGQPWKNSSGSVVNALSEPAVHRTATDKEGSVEQVAENVLPAVVSIRVSNGYSVEEGSGSIISDDGNILTNNHVVSSAQQGGEITVLLNDGKEYKADFVAGDGSTDIAVIKLRNASNLPVMSFGNSDELQVGQQVVAIGSPLGLSATVTSGIISALNRPVRASGGEGGESSLIDAVQTDAAINPGNSGGPLVDMQGRLIGMNSVIATNSGDSGQSGSIGLGFAIPVNQARRIAQQLMDEGKVTQPMIGIRLSNNNRERGALVGDVEPDGPAQKAGITQGDLIVGVNDRVIDSADALITAIRARDFGETVTLKVTRPDSGDVRDVKVTLTEKK